MTISPSQSRASRRYHIRRRLCFEWLKENKPEVLEQLSILAKEEAAKDGDGDNEKGENNVLLRNKLLPR